MYGMLEQGSTGLPPSVPFEQPKNLFRYGEQTLWSTQLHAGAAGAVSLANGTFRLFTTPLGQVGQGFTNSLTIAETSLKEGGRVPAGIAYDVYGISCQIGTANATGDGGNLGDGVTGDALRVLSEIQTNGILSWDFTQTQVDIAPIQLVGAGGGAFGSVSIDDAGAGAVTTVGNMNNGAGSVFLYRKHPVALPGNSTFSILLRYGSRMGSLNAGQSSMFVKVVLMGYYKNVIEIG
jgi:hypothetical protein